jgi:hypothetical protein
MSENGNGRVLNEHGDGVKLSKDGQRWKVWLGGTAAVYGREEVAYLRSTVITLAAHDREEAANVGLLIHGLKSRFDAVLMTPEEVAEHDAVVEGCPVAAPALVDPDFGPRAGKLQRDPQRTAWEAANGIAMVTGRQRRDVLAALVAAERGLTDEELRTITTHRRARTRRQELQEAGWVEDSGRVRPVASGNDAIVWALTEAAARAYGKLPPIAADEP